MKINTKHIGLCLLLGAAMSTTSCNDLLDLDPVSQITPESFYAVEAALYAMWRKCPKQIRKKTSLTFVVGWDAWDAYDQYISDKQ